MIAEILVLLTGLYCAIGLLFAIAFVAVGIGRIDPAAQASGWGFRLLALPGSAFLWPSLALRWARGEEPPEEFGPHRRPRQ